MNDKKSIADKSLEDLQAVVSASKVGQHQLNEAHLMFIVQNKYHIVLQRNHADTADTLASSITWDSSSKLGKSIGFLKILNEAAGIAPVPFLKGVIGTALVLLQMSQVSFAVKSLQCLRTHITELPPDHPGKPRGYGPLS